MPEVAVDCPEDRGIVVDGEDDGLAHLITLLIQASAR